MAAESALSADGDGGEAAAEDQLSGGQRDLAVTANTYTHVLTDEAELDYESLLDG